MFIYFWDRERKSMRGGGAEREGDRIPSRFQALSCQHTAQRGARTHELWDHDLSQSRTLNRLSHPGAPGYYYSYCYHPAPLVLPTKVLQKLMITTSLVKKPTLLSFSWRAALYWHNLCLNFESSMPGLLGLPQHELERKLRTGRAITKEKMAHCMSALWGWESSTVSTGTRQTWG